MKHYMPQISWHDRSAILSIDFQRNSIDLKNDHYKLVTGSIQKEIRVCSLNYSNRLNE
jgi:hypothetical protein